MSNLEVDEKMIQSQSEEGFAEETQLDELLNSDYAKRYYISSLIANNAIKDLSNNLFIQDISGNNVSENVNDYIPNKSDEHNTDASNNEVTQIIETNNDAVSPSIIENKVSTLYNVSNSFNSYYIDEDGNEIKNIDNSRINNTLTPDEIEFSFGFRSKKDNKYIYGSKCINTKINIPTKKAELANKNNESYKYYYLSLFIFIVRYMMEIYLKFSINKEDLSENYNIFISIFINYLFIKYITKPSYVFNIYRFLTISWLYALLYVANK